jgi:citrate lyase subunit beta/citryl-CoA lyase
MSVPASSERFLAKARELAADEVMLDLEDSVAPAAKDTARDLAVGALKAGGWDGRLVAVRINGASTPWAYKDVIAVVEGAPGAAAGPPGPPGPPGPQGPPEPPRPPESAA